jgi:hypothetical protein
VKTGATFVEGGMIVEGSKLPKQVVGNTGLYCVCYQLSKRGWNAPPASRNAKRGE